MSVLASPIPVHHCAPTPGGSSVCSRGRAADRQEATGQRLAMGNAVSPSAPTRSRPAAVACVPHVQNPLPLRVPTGQDRMPRPPDIVSAPHEMAP